jgi:GntR family transcriptional repressor for pyruvate dehydrogenase complex
MGGISYVSSMHLSDSWTAGQSKISRLSASEAVLGDLRNAIEKGDPAVGTRLPSEAAMASRYGVSRSVIREALRSCETLGLTKTQTGKGTFVIADKAATDLTMGEFSGGDLLEARPHIEVPAAGLAAARRSPNDIATLHRLVGAMSATEDPQEWVDLDARFHSAIAGASGNRVFASVLGSIREALLRQSETLNLVAHRRDRSNSEHAAILVAIDAGSRVDAERAMADHLRAVNQAVQDLVAGPR